MELKKPKIDERQNAGRLKNWKENMLAFLQEKKIIHPREDKLDREIREARKEWNSAKKYFNSVTDPDLIDYAIYLIEAAEAKYSFLLKQKKLRKQD